MGVSTLWFNGQFWLVMYEVIDDDGVRASQRVLVASLRGPSYMRSWTGQVPS